MSIRERGFAAVYDFVIRPVEQAWLGEARARLVGNAEGVVLEVGGGTGANLEHYRKAQRVVLAEPSAPMLEKLYRKLGAALVPVTTVQAPAQDLPYPDGYFDTVVSTLVMCTVPDLDRTLEEIRRVLRPGGEMRFLEHVRGEGSLARWQDRVQPLWSWLCLGCEPNRDIASAIGTAGFEIEWLDRFDAEGELPITRPHIEGVARG